MATSIRTKVFRIAAMLLHAGFPAASLREIQSRVSCIGKRRATSGWIKRDQRLAPHRTFTFTERYPCLQELQMYFQ